MCTFNQPPSSPLRPQTRFFGFSLQSDNAASSTDASPNGTTGEGFQCSRTGPSSPCSFRTTGSPLSPTRPMQFSRRSRPQTASTSFSHASRLRAIAPEFAVGLSLQPAVIKAVTVAAAAEGDPYAASQQCDVHSVKPQISLGPAAETDAAGLVADGRAAVMSVVGCKIVAAASATGSPLRRPRTPSSGSLTSKATVEEPASPSWAVNLPSNRPASSLIRKIAG